MSFTTEEMSFTAIDSNREEVRQPDMCAHCNLSTGGEHQGNCPLGKRLQGKGAGKKNEKNYRRVSMQYQCRRTDSGMG